MCKEKDDIRSEMLGIRAEIPPAEAKKAGSAVIDGLLSFLSQHTFPEQKRGITLFSSIRGEIDLLPEAYRFEEIGFDICLPRIDHEKMHFFRYHTSDPLTPGVFGIQEPVSSAQIVSPAQIAIAVCPGLAFDVAGYRIGYGKGFYDQYFAQYQRTVPDHDRCSLPVSGPCTCTSRYNGCPHGLYLFTRKLFTLSGN